MVSRMLVTLNSVTFTFAVLCVSSLPQGFREWFVRIERSTVQQISNGQYLTRVKSSTSTAHLLTTTSIINLYVRYVLVPGQTNSKKDIQPVTCKTWILQIFLHVIYRYFRVLCFIILSVTLCIRIIIYYTSIGHGTIYC